MNAGFRLLGGKVIPFDRDASARLKTKKAADEARAYAGDASKALADAREAKAKAEEAVAMASQAVRDAEAVVIRGNTDMDAKGQAAAAEARRTLADAMTAVHVAQMAGDQANRVLAEIENWHGRMVTIAKETGELVTVVNAKVGELVGISSITFEEDDLIICLTNGQCYRKRVRGLRGYGGAGPNGRNGVPGATGPAGPTSSYTRATATANYSLVGAASTLLLVDATAGNVIVTFPLAADAMTVDHIVQKIDASANTVTLTGDSFNGDGDAIITQRNTAVHLYPTATLGYRIG